MKIIKVKPKIIAREKTKTISFRVNVNTYDLIKEYSDESEYNKSDILRKLVILALMPEIHEFNTHIKN